MSDEIFEDYDFPMATAARGVFRDLRLPGYSGNLIPGGGDDPVMRDRQALPTQPSAGEPFDNRLLAGTTARRPGRRLARYKRGERHDRYRT